MNPVHQAMGEVRKIFPNSYFNIDGSIIINHLDIEYGIRTRKYNDLKVDLSDDALAKLIADEVIGLAIAKIRKTITQK